MKKLFYYFVIAGMSLTIQSFGQNSTFSVQYSMAFGAADVKNYISSPSFRGINFEYRYHTSPNVGVGVDFGWNVLYERRAYDTYTSGTVALSGTQYRYINAVPLYFAADYQFKPGEKFNPFVGLGVGTLFTSRDTDMGLYTSRTEDWAFAMRPQVGVLTSLNPDLDLILVAKYNYGFSTNDLPAQTYFTFNIGFVFKK